MRESSKITLHAWLQKALLGFCFSLLKQAIYSRHRDVYFPGSGRPFGNMLRIISMNSFASFAVMVQHQFQTQEKVKVSVSGASVVVVLSELTIFVLVFVLRESSRKYVIRRSKNKTQFLRLSLIFFFFLLQQHFLVVFLVVVGSVVASVVVGSVCTLVAAKSKISNTFPWNFIFSSLVGSVVVLPLNFCQFKLSKISNLTHNKHRRLRQTFRSLLPMLDREWCLGFLEESI